jgi:hypothetical protein
MKMENIINKGRKNLIAWTRKMQSGLFFFAEQIIA